MSRDASTGGSVVQQTSLAFALPRPPSVRWGAEGGWRSHDFSRRAGKLPNQLSLYLHALPKRYITLNVFSLLLGGWIVPGSVLVHLPIHLNAVITG